MKVLGRVGVSVVMLLFMTAGISYGQSAGRQSFTTGVERASQGEFEEAKEEFEKALKVDPSFGSAKRALKVIDDVTDKKIESNTAIYLFKGIAYYIKGQLDEAIAEYNKALELNRKFADAYRCRGIGYLRKHQYDQAISDCNKAIEINPRYAANYICRGCVHQTKGQYDQAISDFNKAIEINPRDAEAYRMRGDAYGATDQYDRAISDYTKAIELNPRDAMAYCDRGDAYGRKRQYDQAISDFSKAIEINPRYAYAYSSRGVAYHVKGQYDRAINDYTKALEINPKYAGAYHIRGNAWEMKGDLDQAIADYTKAVEINPRYSEAYVNRAAIWFNKGDMERAIADFLRRALCFASNDEEFQAALAALEGRSGRKEESAQRLVPFLGIEGSKGEWTPEKLKLAAAGCATAILIPQLQGIKKKAGFADGEMPPEQLRMTIEVLLPILEEFCGCVFDKVSSTYSYEECSKDPAAMKYITEIIESGECPLPSFKER